MACDGPIVHSPVTGFQTSALLTADACALRPRAPPVTSTRPSGSTVATLSTRTELAASVLETRGAPSRTSTTVAAGEPLDSHRMRPGRNIADPDDPADTAAGRLPARTTAPRPEVST